MSVPKSHTGHALAACVVASAVATLAACTSEEPSTAVATTSQPAAAASPPGPPAAPEVGGDPVLVSRNDGAPVPLLARASLRPTEGHTTSGVVELREMPDGNLGISVELAELSEGKHGLHVHETGDCSAPDASSAGEHFSPNGHAHGSPTEPVHHAGDLGNVTADSRGIAVTRLETSDLKLSGAASAVGRALIVHTGEDDFTSQPSGNSGDRAACGVIRMIEERPTTG